MPLLLFHTKPHSKLQACEVSVFAVRVGGIPEVVTASEAGFLNEATRKK